MIHQHAEPLWTRTKCIKRIHQGRGGSSHESWTENRLALMCQFVPIIELDRYKEIFSSISFRLTLLYTSSDGVLSDASLVFLLLNLVRVTNVNETEHDRAMFACSE